MQQPLDNLLTTLDRALRSVLASPVAARPMPGADLPEAALSDAERREAASLMRVNHAGEIAAQALYHGQAAFAQRPTCCYRQPVRKPITSLGASNV